MGNVKIIVALRAILINKFKFAGTTSGSVRYLIKCCNEKIIYRKQAVDGLLYIFLGTSRDL